jgi:hypothetical protein
VGLQAHFHPAAATFSPERRMMFFLVDEVEHPGAVAAHDAAVRNHPRQTSPVASAFFR